MNILKKLFGRASGVSPAPKPSYPNVDRIEVNLRDGSVQTFVALPGETLIVGASSKYVWIRRDRADWDRTLLVSAFHRDVFAFTRTIYSDMEVLQ